MIRLLAAMAIVTATAFAQPQSQEQGPWSEQPPYPQQPQYGPQPQAGPPPADADPQAAQHAVARISFMTGNVSVRRGDSADLIAAVLNAPLTVGDRVVTGDNARAEVQLDSANFFRLAPGSEVRLGDLQRGRYQVEVAAGTITYRVLRDSNAQVEISTPSISVRPVHIGVYRIDVRPDGITQVTLRGGADGEVFGPKGSEPIHNNSTMQVRGDANDPEFQMTATPAEDDFDRWSAQRDQTILRAASPGHVNPDIYGTEDMDPYGHWVNDGAYGQVWVPTVAPGWAPYACGRWVWIAYYGWTWVGCEPWGWAPYHFGRWYYGSFGWAWWPGPVGAAFWSPALVGFFGWGAPGIGVGVGFGFGFANVGWVPLAPYERFRPWYGAAGFRNAIVNVNVSNIYRNARVANGITGVRAGEFGRGNVSSVAMVRPTAGELARAGAVNGRLPMPVSNASRQFTSRAANLQGAPHVAQNTRFFSSPSFSRGAGRSGSTVNAGGVRSAESGAARGSSGGWQRVSPGGSYHDASNAGRGGSAGGWGRFPAGGAQPQLRINPSIVQNPGSQSRGADRGGSGGSRGEYSRPAAPRGGASRGGGGSRGGGSHSERK